MNLLSGASLDDIPFAMALEAHRNTSFAPEDRARQAQESYLRHMQDVEERLLRIADDQESVKAAMMRYREGYLRRYFEILRTKGRTLSSMITGPAKFPTARNRKVLDREASLTDDFLAWSDRAIRAMQRDLTPATAREDKIAQAEADRERIKAMNKIARSSAPDKVDQLEAYGLTRQNAEQLAHDGGFPDYVLTNLGARIRDMKKRAEIAAQRDATPTGTCAFTGGRIVDNREDDRVQVIFDDKPPETMRAALKARGFRWSPKSGAWQRVRTEKALRDAIEIVGTEASDD